MTCPVSTAHSLGAFVGPGLGSGPVYPVIGDSGVLSFNYPASQTSQSLSAGGNWGGQKVLWVAAASYRGPVLIRGRQLGGRNAIGFGLAAVPVADMQLLAPGASSPGEPPGWREWPSYTRLRGSGCYAYQVDGASFSTLIVFRAVAPFAQGAATVAVRRAVREVLRVDGVGNAYFGGSSAAVRRAVDSLVGSAAAPTCAVAAAALTTRSSGGMSGPQMASLR